MTFVTFAWIAASTLPASAHPEVDDAVPEQDAAGAVTELVVEFTERVAAIPGGVVLLDASGTPVQAEVLVDGSTLRVRPAAPVGGDYALRWTVRGADGHVVAGTVRGGAGGTRSVEAAAEPGAWRALGAGARGLAYAGVLAAAGSLAFALRVLGRGDPDGPALASLTSLAAVVVVGATAVEVAARVGEVAAGSAAAGFGESVRAALGGSVGGAAALRAGGAAALLTAARRGPAAGRATAGAVLAAAAVVVSLPLSGHTAATSPAALVVAGGAVHVAAAAVWAGGVLALAVVLRRRRRRGEPPAAGPLVARFGRLAALALAAVAATGIVMAAAILPSRAALVDTAFGRVLLLKTALAAAVVGVALGVRRSARPSRPRGAPRRLLALEALLFVLVVGTTAVLVDARTRATSPIAARAAGATSGPAGQVRGRLPADEAAALARLAATSVPLPSDVAAHDHGEGHGAFGPVEEVPLSAEEERRLAAQWEEATDAARRLADPDVAHAEGYVQASSQVAGVGSHWVKWSLVGLPFDPARPSMLLFDHSRRDEPPRLAGFSYWVGSSGVPEGFAGPNDEWHRHTGLCFVRGWHRGEGIADPSACEGAWIDGLDLWMLHAWVVPDRPNRWGRFAPANPDLCPPWNRVPDIASCSPLDV